MRKNRFQFFIKYEKPLPIADDGLLQRIGEACLSAEGISLPCAAYLTFTDDTRIRSINAAYRNTDQSTDVLSFPSACFLPDRTAGQNQDLLRREWDVEAGACILGDIIISVDHAQAQAKAYGHSFVREICYLTAHAIFHLMGYDHINLQDKERMRTMEEKALNASGISRISDDILIEKARNAMLFSYSPYSGFKVGACLLSTDGQTFTGCNIENASYGATNCAERTALFKAVSEGVLSFSAIAIAADEDMPWPCGICRQALNEFAPDLRVIVVCGDRREEALLSQLLPHGFGPAQGTDSFLKKEI